ncbi:MAG TPA: endonuclease/exonuclease/phosphatase family protein [Deltaproteobacteria bacterium]|nr:endonuclease/exonuclease/phosphatase family protein [Deltaproteobacteria bacterium]
MRWPFVVPLLLVACDRAPPTPDSVYEPDETETPEGESPTIRLATWNIEVLGVPGAEEYEATLATLARIDADVVGLNELSQGEETRLELLAEALGYDVISLPDHTPFGFEKNAVLSRLPAVSTRAWTSEDLSGDPQANDLTRLPVGAVLEAPWGGTLAVVSQHCKSGFDDIDEFRRTIDALRTGQAAAQSGATHRVVFGDLNEDPSELIDAPLSPSVFSSIPGGAPSGYRLGEDVEALLSDGLTNGPFVALASLGFTPIESAQRDGRVATRDSGRWIDHVLLDGTLEVIGAEIYDSTDESGEGGLAKSGEPPARETSRIASDHLPVFVDLTRAR